jgi:hypothetical protein
MLDTFKTEPDFVNDLGIKWWYDESSTTYARRPDAYGTCLPKVTCFKIEFPSGERSFIITEDQQPIWEGKRLEDMGIEIDKMKLHIRMYPTFQS